LVTVNLDDPDEAIETAASMRQQAEVLSERERRHRHAQKQLKLLTRLRPSPYFGRIDFVETVEEKPQRIYVGLAALLDEEEQEFLIYDWRAPIASLYYDYGPGPAQYETPAGTVTGTMELKRQYIIRKGRIESLFDTGITIGDALLQAVLGRQGDAQMKTIVATIQREQNRIIRSAGNRLLIVQGAAGSGKTSAALQRVAYLLYRDRKTLQADQILLFSPNPMFNSYVSTVLPELGEENMAQTTFQEYLERQLASTFQVEDPFTQMETLLTTVDETKTQVRLAGIHLKSSLDFMHILDRYRFELGRQGLIFKPIRFRGHTLIPANKIQRFFYSLDPALSIPSRLDQTVNWLLTELKKQARLERKKAWVEEAIQFLDRETYIDTYQKLWGKKPFTEDTFDDYDREYARLAASVVHEHFKPLRAEVKRLHFLDMPAVYRQLFADPSRIRQWIAPDSLPPEWEAIAAATAEQLERLELAYEDTTAYLYFKQKIEGFQTVSSVRHLFIDEAQDYSPFQFRFMRQLFPRASMTVLGDPNQSIHPHASRTDLETLPSLLGEEQAEIIRLTRSYRSTQPIIRFTSRILPGGEMIQPFHRTGEKPTLTRASDQADLHQKIIERIHALQAKGHPTIAIITKTFAESREVFEALHPDLPLRLIRKETASFQAGTVVIPSYLAKGIEFDAVILYNGSQERYGRERDRNLFYTACTRAMHELHVMFIGEKSLFLSAIPEDRYQEG
jgi:DNA helicase-2/ATP-dependent DNA helicase PcrA